MFRAGPTFARAVLAKVFISTSYPNTAIAVELESQFLAEALLKRLETAVEAKSTEMCGCPHLADAIAPLIKQLDSNTLLPAWEEIRAIKTLLGPGDKVKQRESAGTIELSLGDRYGCRFRITVSEQYPEGGIQLTPLHSDFHDSLVRLYFAQASQMVRFLCLGINPNEAARRSLGQPATKKTGSDLEPVADLSTGGLLKLKHDMQWFKERKAEVGASDGKAKARRIRR